MELTFRMRPPIWSRGPGSKIRVAYSPLSTACRTSVVLAILGTKLVVVMAHTSCGAVGAAIAGGAPSDSLDHLLSQIRPAIEAGGANEVDAVAWRSARLSAKRLGEDSDIIRGAVEKEGARIVTAFYHLETGEVEFE